MNRIKDNDKTENLVRGWWEGSMCRDEYMRDTTDTYNEGRNMVGGVSVVTNGTLTSHIVEQGGDNRNLGRWRWITVRGKDQKKTCFIGTYRSGEGSVCEQNQLAALRGTEEGATQLLEPNKVWKKDLTELISTKKQAAGCGIVIMGDFNQDLKDLCCDMNQIVRELGLREPLLEKYGAENAPNTYLIPLATIVSFG